MSTFEEAFEETGHGVFNYVVLLTCGLILLYSMMESLGVGYIITAAQCDLGLTPNEKGMINAAAFIGILSTAIIWGYLSDRYGRRAVMLPAIAVSTVASVSSAFSGNFWTLFLLRFLTGALVSASSATVFAYLGEMHSDQRRSSAIAYGSIFMAFNFVFLSVLAWMILPGHWSFYVANVRLVPWRVFIWSWSTPGLLAGIIMLFLPESPRYLYAAKGQLRALPVLAKIYAWNHRDKTPDDYPVKTIRIMTKAIAQRGFRNAFANLGQLMRPPLLRCVLISHFSMFMVFLMSSGLYTWMPYILDLMLDNAQRSLGMCDIVLGERQKQGLQVKTLDCEPKQLNYLVFPISMGTGVACAVAYFLVGYSMRPHNQKRFYCVLLASCSLILLMGILVPEPVTGIILITLGLSSGCAGSVLAAIAVEVFPTSVRALALCTLYMCGRTGAAIGANLIGLGLQQHCVVVLGMITLVTAGSTLLMLMWPVPSEVRTIMEGRGFAY